MEHDAPPDENLHVPVHELARLPAGPAEFPTPPRRDGAAPFRRRLWLPALLFAATGLSTFLAGAMNYQWSLVDGAQYAAAVMAILLAHEMGHYVQSRRYGVPATLPLFIPMPFGPIGTMGAVILQRAGVANRKAMFDIAVSGPLAGLVVAIPALMWGLQYSGIAQLPERGVVWLYGEPLIVKWLISWKFGPLLPNEEAVLHPVAFAGWVGIFITALNLIPISQLDGGHILYTLVGRRAHAIAQVLWMAAVAAMIFGGIYIDGQYFSWSLMLLLVWMMGLRHPPTLDEHARLGWGRVGLGWLTLLFLVIGFTPLPMYQKVLRPDSERLVGLVVRPKLSHTLDEMRQNAASTEDGEPGF